MQNAFKAASVRNGSTELAPLAPLNLLRAGVPAREVVWYRRLTPAERMIALRTTRGRLLLEKVRDFEHRNSGGALAMPA